MNGKRMLPLIGKSSQTSCSLFPGNVRSGRAGFTFSVVRFPFLSVIARPGSMFASLVGLGSTVGNLLIKERMT